VPREIPTERILEMLRGRDDHDDAARADLELPDPVDPDRDAGLLTKFGVHPPELMGGLSREEPTVLEDMPNFRMWTLQQDVASAARSGIPGEEIDKLVIDPSPITDAEKDALRIYCWSFLPRFELHRMALERLRELTFPDGRDAAADEPMA
jgi:hypothetical protein